MSFGFLFEGGLAEEGLLDSSFLVEEDNWNGFCTVVDLTGPAKGAETWFLGAIRVVGSLLLG